MKKPTLSQICTIWCIVLLSSFALAKNDLSFMSYNVRRKGTDPEEHQWNNRKELVFKQILSKTPTIIGFQEVVKGEQFEDLKQGLPEYDSFGESRKNKSTSWLQWAVMKHPKAKDEINPIFYNRNEVELLDSETVGINPSDIIFPSWLPRIFSYGRFKDLDSGKEFCIINTHLDKDSKTIRNKQIKLILKYVKKNTDNLPVIIMGDFNTVIEGDTEKIFDKADFTHARESKIVRGPKKTRTGWSDDELKEIDHILLKNALSKEYEVIKNPEGQYPSDHQPVYANVVLM
jgi:endonuclease/exonuclease/phosphatase family metal-dependent hydrolase